MFLPVITGLVNLGRFVAGAARAIGQLRQAMGELAENARDAVRGLQETFGSFQVRTKHYSNRLPAIKKSLGPALDKAVLALAQEIETEAKGRAPVKTGALRDSIQHRSLGRGRAEVWVGVLYAGYLEWGTRRMPAQPYWTPAIEAVRARAASIVADHVRQAIR